MANGEDEGAPAISHPSDLWEKVAPKQISLRLVMELSLTEAELREYDALPAEGALESVRALKTLHLEWQGIAEIAGLEPFESAEVLYLQANRLERIEGLECLPRLQFLALQSNRIATVENLLCLPELELLDLSRNRIDNLDVGQFPQKINILNLRGNACTEAADYKSRLLARLRDLYTLDGVDLEEGGEKEAAAPAAAVADHEALPIATEQGLSAYWKRGDLHAGMTAEMQEHIQAYSVESLADPADFGKLVSGATARSKARREAMPLPSPKAVSTHQSPEDS